MTDAKAIFDYQREAQVTLSSNFHGDKVPLRLLENVLDWLIAHGNNADEIKKAVFYGRGIDGFAHMIERGEKSMSEIGETICPGERERGEVIFHSIIGKITEAIELGELLRDVLFGGKHFDAVNFVEEIGDSQWYDAIGLDAVCSTFHVAQTINIQKLRARFPNQFTEYDANNRDLFTERAILEQREVTRVGALEVETVERIYETTDKSQAWECKIGSMNGVTVPPGGDLPMRNAVREAFERVTGEKAEAIFSGWGSAFTEDERAVMENRAPFTGEALAKIGGPATPEEQRILDDPEFGGTLADLRKGKEPQQPLQATAEMLNRAAARGLRIEISGPTACGKGLAEQVISDLIPNAWVVDKSSEA